MSRSASLTWKSPVVVVLLLTGSGFWLAGSSPRKGTPQARLDPDALRGPEHCAQCHPAQYRQWRGSMHAYSALDPVFQAMHRRAREETQGEIGDLCVSCHVPLGVRTGEVRGDYEYGELSEASRAGVSCEFCHKVEGPEPTKAAANASLRLSAGSAVHGTLPGPRPTSAHPSVTTEFLGEGEFCGRCHDVQRRSSLLEKTHAQWSTSVHRDRGNSCQDCHMTRYSGRAAVDGPFRETLRRHDFPAVSLALVPFPDQGRRRERVEELLRSTARLSVHVPDLLQADSEASLPVSVKNIGAGHNVPSGFSTKRQMWIRLEVRTEDGQLLFQSGQLDSNGDLLDHRSELEPGGDPWLVQFSDRFLDASGKEVRFLWEAAKLDERSLKPLEEREAVYRWKVPPDLAGARLRITAHLLFRPLPPHLLRDLDLDDLVARLPTWEMDSFESDLVPVVEKLPRSTEHTVPGSHDSIQAAIDAARDGDTVLVRPGEHVVEAPIDFRGKAICVRSLAGAASTVLRYGGDPDAPAASVVVFHGGETSETGLLGFTIAGGRGMRLGDHRQGGGIRISGASPLIADNTITDCTAVGGAGGGIASEGGAPTLVRNRILSCQAEQGAAIAVLSADRPLVVSGGSLEGNVARRGGALFVGPAGKLLLEQSVLAGNVAWDDGAVAWVSHGATLDLRNVTIVHNISAPESSIVSRPSGPAEGGARVGAPQARASNCILWGNTPMQSGLETSWCLIGSESLPGSPGHTTGVGDLREFPLFVDPGGAWNPGPRPLEGTSDGPGPWQMGRWVGGDYRLLPGSPAIDSGDPRSPPDPDDTRADRGAFFFEQPLRAFVRGDLNGDARTGPADLMLLVRHLMATTAPACADAADVNDSGEVDPVDLLSLALYVTAGFPEPARPFPDCGPDPTFGEGLSCRQEAPGCR